MGFFHLETYIAISSVSFRAMISHFLSSENNMLVSDTPKFVFLFFISVALTPAEGHVGGFQAWGVMNKAAVNIFIDVYALACK